MSVPADTVVGCLLERAGRSPTATAYRARTPDGWLGRDWHWVLERVRTLSAHLIRLGLAPGDRVAILMPTTIEWELCHLASLASGCAVVGLDAHDAAANVEHILRTTAPRALVVAEAQRLPGLIGALDTPPVVCLTVSAADPPDARGQSLQVLLDTPCETPAGWPLARPDGLATVIFTSGSTGAPRGVPYTHRQVCLACQTILERFHGIGEGARFACWLPLSNLFQRIINLCGIVRGGESFFVEDPTRIVEYLPEIRPAIFIGVPRFYEKLHAGIEARLAAQPRPVRALLGYARRLGAARSRALREGRRPGAMLRLGHALADRLLLARIRALAGNDLQFMVSGSAPLPGWLMESFHAIGWLVLEAYGISENIVPIAINAPEAYRFGSVGRPLPVNELRLAEDGELLVRGPGVFTGYFGDTVGAGVDGDGFLHTGDLARLDADGYVWLVGRKSDVFKTSTGRKVAPAGVEAQLKRIGCVDHAVVIGRGRPVPVVLLALNAQALPEPVAPGTPLGASMLARLSREIATVCAELPARDRPAGALVIRSAFTIAGGELTANLKLRRGPIEEKYRPGIDVLYDLVAKRSADADPAILEAP